MSFPTQDRRRPLHPPRAPWHPRQLWRPVALLALLTSSAAAEAPGWLNQGNDPWQELEREAEAYRAGQRPAEAARPQVAPPARVAMEAAPDEAPAPPQARPPRARITELPPDDPYYTPLTDPMDVPLRDPMGGTLPPAAARRAPAPPSWADEDGFAPSLDDQVADDFGAPPAAAPCPLDQPPAADIAALDEAPQAGEIDDEIDDAPADDLDDEGGAPDLSADVAPLAASAAALAAEAGALAAEAEAIEAELQADLDALNAELSDAPSEATPPAEPPLAPVAPAAIDDAAPWLGEHIDPARPDLTRVSLAIVEATNAARVAHGLKPVASHAALNAAAGEHARRMAELGFFDHVDPHDAAHRTPTDRVALAGVANPKTAENIATQLVLDHTGEGPLWDAGGGFSATPGGPALPAHTYRSFAARVVQRWLDSPGHRRNLLAKEARQMGAGAARFVQAGGMPTLTAVQVFQWHEPVRTQPLPRRPVVRR